MFHRPREYFLFGNFRSLNLIPFPDRSYFSIQISGSPGYSVGDAGLTLFIS